MSTDPWWRGAALYQIYPRSFADSNGDGIGDLPGITARLAHLAWLGADGVWLSPFFPSPMRDFGYDVSDYCGVDPMFGTLADFDALVERAHALGLKVVIDQVWSHTAQEHPWFQERRSRRDKRGDIPAAMQQHLFNVCQPQTLPFLERVRALLDEFDAPAGRAPGRSQAGPNPLRGSPGRPDGRRARLAVAEIGSQDNLARMIEYTRGSDRLHTAYSFLLLGPQPRADAIAAMMEPWQHGEGATAWPSWALSNHDVPRIASRWAQGDAARARQLIVLLACLRGTVFLYQGEELGLPQADVAFEDLQDPFGKNHWPRDKGRDGCRTPMPWVADMPAAGRPRFHAEPHAPRAGAAP